MTRAALQKEILLLDQELLAARDRLREAQRLARMTGLRTPNAEYTALWNRIYTLERSIGAARLQLSLAEETEAEKAWAIIRSDYPKAFAAVSKRLTGVDASGSDPVAV